MSIPILDLGCTDRSALAAQLRECCRQHGFFYLIGHGVSPELMERLERLSHEFFAHSLEQKMRLRMDLGGRAWRGYFRVGDELTSGRPDQKEGLYFGQELPDHHPDVQAGTPLHGRNLFPDFVPELGPTVLEYIEAVAAVGHAVLELVALSLNLEPDYFRSRYTADPLVLFRIFHYPPGGDDAWGVGEHTDYGVLTILRQDEVGGLQVKTPSGWVDAPPIPGAFVCNIGDMLDRMTGGFYRSTPHRVRNLSGRSRYSFPVFFDPNFHAHVRAIDPAQQRDDDQQQRWDGASVHQFSGSYGDYILSKVAKVFPQLTRDLL
jgi:isopenicillin N synthase-like dioxygenase